MKNVFVSLQELLILAFFFFFFAGVSPNKLDQKRFKMVGRLKWWHLLRQLNFCFGLFNAHHGNASDWGTKPIQSWWCPLVVMDSFINNLTIYFGSFYVIAPGALWSNFGRDGGWPREGPGLSKPDAYVI